MLKYMHELKDYGFGKIMKVYKGTRLIGTLKRGVVYTNLNGNTSFNISSGHFPWFTDSETRVRLI